MWTNCFSCRSAAAAQQAGFAQIARSPIPECGEGTATAASCVSYASSICSGTDAIGRASSSRCTTCRLPASPRRPPLMTPGGRQHWFCRCRSSSQDCRASGDAPSLLYICHPELGDLILVLPFLALMTHLPTSPLELVCRQLSASELVRDEDEPMVDDDVTEDVSANPTSAGALPARWVSDCSSLHACPHSTHLTSSPGWSARVIFVECNILMMHIT